MNFWGKGYGDNPSYIAEKFRASDKAYDLVWLVNSIEQNDIPEDIKKVKIRSIKRFYYLTTAKVVISNMRFFWGVDKRKNQIYLQTWHGPMAGAKRVEKDAENVLSDEYIWEAKWDAKHSDGILINSLLSEKVCKRAFWLHGNTEILKFGLPRNDYLFNNKDNINIRNCIKEKLDLPKDIVVILYAPTYRDACSEDIYFQKFDELVSAYEQSTQKKCIILLRFHPNLVGNIKLSNKWNCVIDVSNYPNVQEVALISDILITDYSSLVFDFVLLDKPVVIYASDIKEYEKERGLTREFYEYPFPVAETDADLIKLFVEMDLDDYYSKVNKYFSKYKIYDDGNAASRTYEWLVNKMV